MPNSGLMQPGPRELERHVAGIHTTSASKYQQI